MKLNILLFLVQVYNTSEPQKLLIFCNAFFYHLDEIFFGNQMAHVVLFTQGKLKKKLKAPRARRFITGIRRALPPYLSDQSWKDYKCALI